MTAAGVLEPCVRWAGGSDENQIFPKSCTSMSDEAQVMKGGNMGMQCLKRDENVSLADPDCSLV